MDPLQTKLLVALYDNHSDPHGTIFNFRDWAEREREEFEPVRRAFHELDELGLAEVAALGPHIQITVGGRLHVEDNKLVDEDLIRHRHRFRTLFLDALAEARDEHGPNSVIDFKSVLDDAGLEERDFRLDHDLLKACGLIKFITMGGLSITPKGYDVVLEWRRKVRHGEALEQLSSGDVSPQSRGHKLERLLEEAAVKERWRVDRNVRRPGEEVDLILSRDFSYFILSSKWEKTPIEVAAVRDLRERITHRPSSRGILVSMSGFSSGAAEYATERLESAVILLFGPRDIERWMAGEFSELLSGKLHVAMTIRTLNWE